MDCGLWKNAYLFLTLTLTSETSIQDPSMAAAGYVIEGTSLFFSAVFLLLLPLLLFTIFKQFKSSLKAPTLPPGPYQWPILGNILHMGNKPHISLTHFAQSYGPLISLRLRTQILIVGSSPEAASEILKTNDRVLSGRFVPHSLMVKKPELNVLSLVWTFECSDRWKYLRTLCRTELFSSRALESQSGLREKKAVEMAEFLGEMEGKVVSVGEVAFATVFNMLSNVLMSRDFISMVDEDEDGGMKSHVRAPMEIATAPNLADFYSIFVKFDLQNLRKKMNKMMEQFLAGIDTTNSTIEWTMTELIKNPKSMNKAQEELAREITNNQYDSIKESNMPQLPYLHACVKETLRLHPPALLLLHHRVLESCTVMNYTIPKNSEIMVNVWAIGRDPNVWEDPLMFKPERFLLHNSNLDYKGNNFEFIPFSAGRRICPGISMAAKEVPLVLAFMVHFFDWSLPNGLDPKELDMNEKFGVTLQKEQPLLLIPKRRK